MSASAEFAAAYVPPVCLRDLLEVVRLEVGRLDADRVDADALALELLEGRVERRGATDVVAVGQEDDAGAGERGAPHLGDGGG